MTSTKIIDRVHVTDREHASRIIDAQCERQRINRERMFHALNDARRTTRRNQRTVTS